VCLLLCAALLHFTGCAASTPQARAQKNPDLMAAVPARDRDLVLSGTISQGMTRDAVFLAWGQPDAVTKGFERGQETETWRYATMRPVYYSPGFGYGLGYYGGRGRHIYPGLSMNLTPDYVPVTSSVVRFRGGRVVAWETADRRP
jgi:hypothetical protein